jgi:polyisoprenyl-teichoic acid--peptidoglycan teichoic acid transferase
MREKEDNLKKRGHRKLFIFMSAVLFVFIIFAVGTAVTFYDFFNAISSNPSGIKPKVVMDRNEPVNILIMGVDIGEPGSNSKYNSKRTDTIMLLHYNPQNQQGDIISIPRDLLVVINNKNQKINAAHVIGGAAYTIACVEALLDINVNYYGKLNYEGFRDIIDIIGGIEMEITHRMEYDDPGQNLHIRFNKGDIVHLDGKKAEEFFRWRKNNDGTGLETGDLGRIENQHLFIEKVIDKLKTAAIIPKIPQILRTIPQYVETNMSSEEILRYGTAISRLNKEEINMITLHGDPVDIDGISYLIYDEKKNKDVIGIVQSLSGENVPQSDRR